MIAAVVFDLDDTLIVEEATAHASLLTAARLVSGHDPQTIADLVLETAREIWRSGPEYRLCLELGCASWEGLWAYFEGGHPRLDALRTWIPTFRAQTWTAALIKVEIHDLSLSTSMSETYIEAQLRGLFSRTAPQTSNDASSRRRVSKNASRRS